MKNTLLLLFLTLAVINCKENAKEKVVPESSEVKATLSTAQKIANAHGFEHWKNVNEIAFTFAERRQWLWNTQTNNVTLTTEKDTLTYNRKQVDSLSAKTDAAFVNDKFWLLIPFQLVWDKSAKISQATTEEAPISKTQLHKITITYSNEGGYTPGDAYDIYFGNDYIIQEWVFRRGNQEEPSLANTFEDYQDFNGLKIAQSHKKGEGDWNLKLSDIRVSLK